jgi:hypothetical protein
LPLLISPPLPPQPPLFHPSLPWICGIARSHYGETISLEAMSLGYASGYDEKEIEELEKAVVPLS